MNSQKRTFTLLIIAIAAVSVSFAVGRWSGSLKKSLESETDYPWALHRKIGSVDIQCDKLLKTPSVGNFFVQSIDGGAALVIATFNKNTSTVKAFALDSTGAIASDSWPLECK